MCEKIKPKLWQNFWLLSGRCSDFIHAFGLMVLLVNYNVVVYVVYDFTKTFLKLCMVFLKQIILKKNLQMP